MKYEEARQFCEDNGGRLVTIETEEKYNQTVEYLVYWLLGHDIYWVGYDTWTDMTYKTGVSILLFTNISTA